jgi:uncharacterized protein GlcG (DUF336 family)
LSKITLDQANRIIAAAFAKGAEQGMKPLSVAVVDAGGHLMAFQRSDGSPNIRAQVATGKATGSLAMGVNSRAVEAMALARPHFVNAATAAFSQGIVPVAGGVIVVDDAGQAIGAVGVSGDTSDNDEICAIAGIEAAGLKARD